MQLLEEVAKYYPGKQTVLIQVPLFAIYPVEHCVQAVAEVQLKQLVPQAVQVAPFK